MFSPRDLATIRQKISQSGQILITTHRSPDADAMGSSLGLKHLLEKHTGAKVIVMVPDSFPSFLDWMPGTQQTVVFDKNTSEATMMLLSADLIFCLDYNHPSRTASMEKSLREAGATKVMLDHHQEPDNFVDYRWSDTNASSTCELIVAFMDAMQWQQTLDKNIATCLYTGIMTDTGSFRFSATTAHTHRIIARLMDTGIRQWEIHEAIFNQNTFEKLRLWGHAFLNKLELIPEHKTAFISVTEEELKLFHFAEGDLEGLVNYALSIKGMQLGVLFSERAGKIRISFRSVGDFSVQQFASTYFNGGGHKNASGGSSSLTMAETILRFKTCLHTFLNENPPRD